MDNFKRKLRYVVLIFLIVLAAFGVGLTGVAPLSAFKRKSKLSETFKIEELDQRDKKGSSKEQTKP